MLRRSNLFKWQVEAAARAARGSTLIAAQMGSGKTITALTAIADGIAEKRFSRVLLIAPRIILDTVHIPEAARWEHTRHLRFDEFHNGGTGDDDRILFRGTGQIITVTPAVFPRLVEAVVRHGVLPFDAIFADESQRFKNPATVGAGAMLGLCKAISHRVFLSGTPTPNGPIDSWMPGRVIGGGANGGAFWGEIFPAWRSRHFVKQGRFGWRVRPDSAKAIETEMAKFSIAMRLADTSDVPPALYSQYRFNHDLANADRIKDLLTRGSFLVTPDDRRGELRAEGFELTPGDVSWARQLNQGFLYNETVRPDGTRGTHILSLARAMALKELIEEGGISGPVLVAIKYHGDATILRKVFPNLVVFSGATPAGDRAEIIERWNADKIPILAGNPASMGHGINLQHGSAQTVVWFCNDYSYELFAQMNARLIRTGQRKVVSVVQLMSDCGIDDAIVSVLNRKENSERALIQRLMEGR